MQTIALIVSVITLLSAARAEPAPSGAADLHAPAPPAATGAESMRNLGVLCVAVGGALLISDLVLVGIAFTGPIFTLGNRLGDPAITGIAVGAAASSALGIPLWIVGQHRLGGLRRHDVHLGITPGGASVSLRF